MRSGFREITIPLIVYAAGFIAWNLYLGKFGFFEYEFLQTRFISAGILIFVIPGLLFLINPIQKWFFGQNYLAKTMTALFWVLLFSTAFFPQIPQYLGGARPFAVSIVGQQETLSYLEKMGLPSVHLEDRSSVESTKICLIYQNDKFTILGLPFVTETDESITSQPNRVLVMRNEEIKALSILPSSAWVREIACTAIRKSYGI